MRTSISIEDSVTPNTGGYAVSLPLGNSVRTTEPGEFWSFWATRYRCLVQQIFRVYREMYANRAAGRTYYPMQSPTTRLLLSSYRPEEVRVGTGTADEYLASYNGDIDAAERAFLTDLADSVAAGGGVAHDSATETSRERALRADQSDAPVYDRQVGFDETEVTVVADSPRGKSSWFPAILAAGALWAAGGLR